jgi:hypothetical protein
MDNPSPDELVAQKIVDDLIAQRLIIDNDATSLRQRLSDGEMKAEDWIVLASMINVNQ